MSSPWPRVQVGGRLESGEREWLHTNGAGSYSMSTVATRHTRRYHGLLVAALTPPVDRYVVVSHLETSVQTAERTYRLGALQSPDAAPLPGYRFIETFDQDPIPRWVYRLGRSRFERTVALARGRNVVVVGFTWHGPGPAMLHCRPLMPMRPIHALAREHGGMVQRVRLRPGAVEVRPVPSLPAVHFGHRGVFLGAPDWYRKLEYQEDRLRRGPCEEDLWTPGQFEIPIGPGETTYVVVSVGPLPPESPERLVEEAVAKLRSEDPGEERPQAVRQLWIAAEQFCADDCDHPAVIAGYPWLTASARDALVALPGLYLVRGKLAEAKRVLGALVASMHEDLVPRRIAAAGQPHTPPSADATLWLFEAARHVAEVAGVEDPFVRDTLYPALCRVFRRVKETERGVLSLSPEGLVWSGDDEVALQWLDAQTGAPAATPRRGLPVELQALWSRGTDTLARLAGTYGHAEVAVEARAASDAARAAFAARFWCEETGYPYDCIRRADDAVGPIADASIRPSALVALDLDPELFQRWQAQAILDRVRERLLTVRGVRSLDPDEPGYRGEYGGTFEERRIAYQQGLAWTHLLGAHSRASLRLAPGDFEVEENVRVRIEEARVGGLLLGQVAQFADGEPPHRPGGCPAHATAVAELLRTLVWDLGL